MEYKPRLTRPEAGNPYYNRKENGGYSDAILGKPTDAGCNVLPNCVGYAYGRFNEIGGYGRMKYLRPVNAENFIANAGSLTVEQTPSLGACMVWKKGATLNGSDGAGHVAIVEQILSPTRIVTSESGYKCSTPFWTKTRDKGDGNWGAGAGYTFLGFIRNPAVTGTVAASPTATATPTKKPTTPTKEDDDMKLPVLHSGDKGDTVRAMQALLTGYGVSVGISGLDGSFGPATCAALKQYQTQSGLDPDGVCGPKTWHKLLGMGGST